MTSPLWVGHHFCWGRGGLRDHAVSRLCVRTGEAVGCTPLLEILDLSWNSGVGGGALQSLLGNLPPPLKELHLVACQLTAADAAALGTDVRTREPL